MRVKSEVYFCGFGEDCHDIWSEHLHSYVDELIVLTFQFASSSDKTQISRS